MNTINNLVNKIKHGIVFKIWIKWIDLVYKIKTGILFKIWIKWIDISLYSILMIMQCWKWKKWKFAWRADPCPAIFYQVSPQVLTFFTICLFCLQFLITGCSPNPSVKCSPSFQCESCTSPSPRASGGPCNGGSPSSPLHLEQSCGCGSMTQSASEYIYVLKLTVEIDESLIYKCICFILKNVP